MPISQRSSIEANDELQREPSAKYLDVRSEAEFEQGHPPNSYNVPIAFLTPGRPPEMNIDFLRVVESHFQKDAMLIVGCKSGGRSQSACEILEQAGFTNLTNVRGGFHGHRDGGGNAILPGWTDSDLPVETGSSPGKNYADLGPKR